MRWLILAVVAAACTGRIFAVLRAKEQLGDHAFIQTAALVEEKPADRVAGLFVRFLPEPACAGLSRCGGHRRRNRQRACQRACQKARRQRG